MEPQVKTIWAIPGMHCQHCVQTVTSTLTNLPEVGSVQIDLATKTAQVTFHTKPFPFARVERALAEAGYPGASHSGLYRGKALPLAHGANRDAQEDRNPLPFSEEFDVHCSCQIDAQPERMID